MPRLELGPLDNCLRIASRGLSAQPAIETVVSQSFRFPLLLGYVSVVRELVKGS